MNVQEIYHICTATAWKSAVMEGLYEGSDLDRKDGFIHCSAAETVEGTANRFFAGREDLVLLVIDPKRVSGDLKWEPAPDREDILFPHVHGTIPLEAVNGVVPLTPNREGLFRFPEPRNGVLPL
ncbi:MAG: DUF952 domain-containing protein [Rhodospirillum sp.]|nr:DUF952 domain-containing protein [Rhodospirillum sp.]MCF8489984.1 DUF952 domain-containing protein [Rhodospirillum sp.]MCF8501522.1 DUF952 domain-containing protein [Rhodospirillum sp.]